MFYFCIQLTGSHLFTLNNLHTQVYFISSKHHNIFGTIICLLTFQFGTTDEYIITF